MSPRHNPYAKPTGTWLRGSFHGHCDENSRCASVPLAESVRQYSDVGAGFVALTDHDIVTDLRDMAAAYPHLIFLEGFEYSSRENVLFAGPQVDPLYELSIEDAIAKAGHLLTVVCHPRPHADGRDYWTRAMLEELGVWPDGIEVYNGHYGTEAATAVGRQPLYSAFWDELLTAGHRLWGYADDDFHDPSDFDNAFNMVLVEEKTAAAVVRAAKAGRSYASTGLLLESVTEDAGRIEIRVDAACKGAFVGPEGRVLSEGEGTQFKYSAGDEAYVRFEGQGATGRIFLQPMWTS
ncbi:MAG: PHP domain-containing protein [Candidatus Latescibacterota bacterium]|jgi:hypothetical protein